MEPILQVKNLSKKYSIAAKRKPYLSLRESLIEKFARTKNRKHDFWALNEINFNVFAGDTLGVIGRNGAGKSTLLKIISKITFPTKGQIKLKGRVASLLEVGTGFHPELTGRENIFLNGAILGMKRLEIKKRFDEIVNFSGVETFLDTPLKYFSSGMQLRLAFSVAAHLEPEILIIDEVLAVGDYEFQKKCLGKMEDINNNEGRTIIFVSHNLDAVERLCNKVIYLEKGKIAFEGKTVDGITAYTKNNNIRKKVYEKGAIVEKVEVVYGKPLQIIVKYNFKEKPIIPHFGFVISDEKGKSIFGSNPTLAQVKPKKNYPLSGQIRIEIWSPLFSKGIYNLAIWLGNGVEDIFEDPNCITFEIPINNLVKSTIGFISPECKYIFS